MSELTDADYEKYVTLLPPPGSKDMNDELRAKLQALTLERKEFFKQLKERTGISEKGLEKQLKKLHIKKQPNPVKPPAAPKKTAVAATQNDKKAEPEESEDVVRSLAGILPEPKENKGRGGYFVNSDEVLAKHLKETGGKWRTRFPPEPNGHLHIGHAKAMLVDFGQAKLNGGTTYLRFDDTNPEAEKQEYIDKIIEFCGWLGHEPEKVTYSSDHFDTLLELAKELIRRGKAFVCHQTPEEVKASRVELKAYHQAKFKAEQKAKEEGTEVEKVPFPDGAKSPFRDRTVEENLAEFEKMIVGDYKEGEATLRMKMDLESPNANMWDHMAYRVLNSAHPRSGTKYKVYPTYDYTHCLVDSLENITHSLCTLEFADRQAPDGSYHWLVDALGLYHACTWEFSRCSISCNVLSKRKLKRLVEDGLVIGWDDPRLLTLAGLKRRGYTPKAINNFCENIGIARSSNTVCVGKEKLEACIRDELDQNALRVMAVLNPVLVRITNFETAKVVTVQNHPAKPELGQREVELTEEFYIEEEKFRETKSKGYKGLYVGGTVRLMGGVFVTCTGFTKDEASGAIATIEVELLENFEGKPNGTLAWVSTKGTPIKANLWSAPFKDCVIDGVERDADAVAAKRNVDFLELFDHDSLVIRHGFIEPHIDSSAFVEAGKSWQFITLGYFCVDTDSTSDKPVVNMITGLKEGKGK